MTRLVLVRHGEALGVEGRCIGQCDVALSPAGAVGMRRLAADGLASLLAPLTGSTRVSSSDLLRAGDSAEIIAAAIGCDVKRDRRLRELSFGDWEGVSWNDIERRDPEKLRWWMERWTERAAPGGESVDDLQRRASSWVRDAVAGASIDQAIVVISHAGWIRAAACHLLGYPFARMFEIPIDHARATVIDIRAGRVTLVASNVDRI